MPVPKDERVVEPLPATVNWEIPEELATLKISVVGEVDVPCTTKVALGVEEPMPTLWLLVTLKIETPEEEVISKISLLPAVPWILKTMLEEVALMPALVPSSASKPLVRVEADVHLAR